MIKLAKATLATIVLAFSINSIAQTYTIDPTIPGQSKVQISCDMPIEREDGTILAIDEIKQINYYITKNDVRIAEPIISSDCVEIFDLSTVEDGKYVYSITAVDVDHRESKEAPTHVTVNVKRLAPSTPPLNIRSNLL